MLRTGLLDDSNTTAEMATNTKMEMPRGDNGQDKRSKSRGQSVVDGVRRMYALAFGQRKGDGSEEDGDWTPYEHTDICKIRPTYWLRARWCMLYPFQFRICPCWDITIGEIIIILAAVGFVVGADVVVGYTPGGSKADKDNMEQLGAIASIPSIFVWATVCRNSVLTFLLGIPFERSIFWHRLFAYLTILSGFWHGFVAWEQEGWNFGDFEWLSGLIYWAAMALLFLTALNIVRRKLFEFFYRIHWVLLIVTGIFGLAHGAGAMGIGMGLWGLDIVLRYIMQACCVHPREAQLLRLPSDVVRIRFKRENFHYRAGQYVFLCVPALSLFEWHPFSISSAPFEPYVTLHVRVLGNWTKKLADMPGSTPQSKPMTVKIFFDGAYGEPSVDLEGPRYKCILLVSGGIGITPMQSVCNQLLYQYSRGRPLVKVWFVWSVRDKYMIEAIRPADDMDPAKYSGAADDVVPFDAEAGAGGGAGAGAGNGDGSEPGPARRKENSLPFSFSPADTLVAQRCSIRREITGTTVDFEAGTIVKEPTLDNLDDPLHTEFYLTRARPSSKFSEANIDPALQNCLRFGRPDFGDIMDTMRGIASAAGESRVAVLACGPSGLVASARKQCWSASKEGVRFDFHTETFEF